MVFLDKSKFNIFGFDKKRMWQKKWNFLQKISHLNIVVILCLF